jgi:O-acetyl-ADP-ribose deacetylase (regulator of RNase III)
MAELHCAKIIGSCRIILCCGDITEQATDAIVNAANSELQLGAGVAGAIRSKGGAAIQQECDRIGGTPVGSAVITGAGHLRSRFVIHAVGPRQGEVDAEVKLASAVNASLELAVTHGLKSISLPALATGVFGFPIIQAARIMLTEARKQARRGLLTEIRFCLFTPADYAVFATELRRKTAEDLGCEG